ncbi:holo-[acyl-carrier protein] synthase [Saccharothrix ecbatanensis]|uniref:Holo-[acyl-carrier-protein] synthase n=1 Tax=Saccharothrix ecbatanensis TaxID=1105145 RepID=A0A7W9LZL9_9PSEU|nr:holo-ACP synthase [Saccharothrix ecbatanensis]MBB5801837.1 holo-[acyl-carrier protein] synthase [Saccharothrix ecbatanensis]
MTFRLGVGVDLIPVRRVRKLLDDNPQAEADIFTERERAYCSAKRHPYPHFACRFAGKEAVLKALGTGLGPHMRWTDVEIVNAPLGRPGATLSGAVRAAADRLGMSTMELSLSHSGGFAIAQAVLVFEGGPCVST